jgi:hypothetical protein
MMDKGGVVLDAGGSGGGRPRLSPLVPTYYLLPWAPTSLCRQWKEAKKNDANKRARICLLSSCIALLAPTFDPSHPSRRLTRTYLCVHFFTAPVFVLIDEGERTRGVCEYGGACSIPDHTLVAVGQSVAPKPYESMSLSYLCLCSWHYKLSGCLPLGDNILPRAVCEVQHCVPGLLTA